MLKPGTILDDRYEIIDVVGTGGMSTVYRAKDERLKRFVAIKVLKSDYSSDQNFVSKFRAEAQSSAGLTHPNIVSVYDVCEDDGRYFIVMELVEGITLKEYINLNGRLSMSQAIDFSIQIASGLEAAHEHHVIHRDIKPQNIIVSKSGNIKVTDFGIAKAATSTTMSTTGIGSVHYISPEQARGGYSDERSDIYSLGITMYEMVTGRVPFEGDTNVAIALMHIQNEMIPPRQLYPDIFPSFEKIILKASQKKPERRYLTAAALIADLNRVKDNPSIDIIVAPATVTGAPTQQFTNEDMEKIKNGSANKAYDEEMEASGKAAESSEVRPDRSRIEALLNQEDEDFYDERPARKGSLKKIDDDDDGYAMDDEYDDDDESDVDPKLEKAVMIGGIAAAVIVAVIIFVVVGNMMGWFSFGSKEKKTTEATTEASTEEAKIKMVDVVGLSEKAAEKDMKEAGFTNYQFVQENSTDVKEGYVISQNVEAGTEVAKDAQIIITVSAGAAELDVADVKGMDEDAAYETLEKQGFKPTRSYKFDDEIEEGKAISTDPAAGKKAKAGDTIVIYISQGKEEKTVKVPNLSGLTESAAKGALESNTLTAGNVSYEFNSEVASGLVIRQSVPADTEVKEKTTVDFVISNGAEKKSYKGTVTGSISTADETLAASTVTVNVYINDEGGYHLAYTTTQSGATIDVNGAAGGLGYNNGTVSFTVVDANGADVSASYNKSLTLSYQNE
ncbi:MAG: Stk1 family PASTA domain-containing Ser/Thr kinase [Eubacterium sp.]|nr:Stk1 family PASTA domain-containing Ser/Thr kinase [Eubacterium sp.]